MDAASSAVRKEWSKKDYYEVLGVAKDAKPAEIKKAYYKLARQYHPDTSDAPEAEEIFKVVNEAYHVLADESKRATYDKYGREGVASAEGGAADPVEIMKSMFGGDAFEDTFGELNMWETMRMQFMMASGAQLTEEQAQERLQKFAMERQVLLTEKLVAKLVPFVADDVAKFKELIEGDLESKVAAPGGVALLAAIGYVYCQMAQQYMDKFLGIGSFFAKVAEKGHRFKNNMSALGAAVKLTYSAVKLQAKMEAEEQERMRAEEERQRKWMAEHPGELPPGVPAITADNYPFEQDENWKAYERKVEIPAGVDREAALKKVKAKWFEKNIEPHVPKPHVPKEGEAEGAGMGESAEKEPDPLGDHETMRVFDQGLRLMWKLGVMEAEEIARQICREVCDAKSEYNVKAKTSKDVLKKRVTAIHHIGEKFKAVAARLKKDEKKGFTVQDFIDSEMKKEGNGAETPAGGNDNNAPLNPQPETKIDETVPAAAKAMDVD